MTCFETNLRALALHLRDQPRLIVLEGIDGAGTTTQARRLSERLSAHGVEVLTTCEPSSGPVGTLIRGVLTGNVDGEPENWDWKSMGLLFAADRLQHVTREIGPALARGATVISDRYVLSSLAYQSVSANDQGEDTDEALRWLTTLNAHARPADVTLILTVPVDVATQRRSLRGGPVELFDAVGTQQRLATFYESAAATFPGQGLCVLDGDAEPQRVTERLVDALSYVLLDASA